MSFTAVSRNFTVKVVAALVAVAMVFGGIMLASAKDASADPNRDRLRPGCNWDPYNWWVQYCQVFSPAMNRNIPVQIKAATGGGDASLYMLDGLRPVGFGRAILLRLLPMTTSLWLRRLLAMAPSILTGTLRQ